MLHCCLRHVQGVSSLSLNSGTINLTFAAKTALKDRQIVVFHDSSGLMGSYSLPYLFQSLDTANHGIPNYKLSVCDAALSNALKYTDMSGCLGSHPHSPPFPLCRSKLSSTNAPAQQTSSSVNAFFNDASATEGFPILVDDNSEVDPHPDPYGSAAT